MAKALDLADIQDRREFAITHLNFEALPAALRSIMVTLLTHDLPELLEQVAELTGPNRLVIDTTHAQMGVPLPYNLQRNDENDDDA